MSKNYLLIYSEQLATDIEWMCQNIKRTKIINKNPIFREFLRLRLMGSFYLRQNYGYSSKL